MRISCKRGKCVDEDSLKHEFDTLRAENGIDEFDHEMIRKEL